MELTSFRVMSFDCYGTMIDWERGILAAIRPWLEARGCDVPAAEILAAFGVAEADVEAETPGAPYPVVLERVHRRLTTRWGLDPEAAEAHRFATSVLHWPAFDDSPDALARLQRRYRLVVLSNVDRASFAASRDRLGIDFDAVYTAEDIGSYKPDPRNFAHLIDAEGAAGHDRAHILHVGQSLFHDHVPASHAGIATCWIRRPSVAGDHGAARPPERPPRVDFQFTSLEALADAAGV